MIPFLVLAFFYLVLYRRLSLKEALRKRKMTQEINKIFAEEDARFRQKINDLERRLSDGTF